jgi:hypothetical protein
MRKFACAVVVTVCVLSVAMADNIRGRITKIDGDKITVSTKKKGEEAKERTLTLTADTKIYKGSKFNKAEKTFDKGEVIKGGKTTLTKILDKVGDKGINAFIVTEGDKVTEIHLMKGKGKKKE